LNPWLRCHVLATPVSYLSHHSTMASELATDAVVPNINGTDESLPAVGADSAVLNSKEVAKPLTNG